MKLSKTLIFTPDNSQKISHWLTQQMNLKNGHSPEYKTPGNVR